MNQLTAKVIHIENVETLHHLTFELNQQVIHMLSLELNGSLKVNDLLKLNIKSTDIAIAKNVLGMLSYENQLKAKVVSVNNGKLLSSIGIEIEGFILESVIGVKASLKMELKEGDDVVVLFRGSEVSLF